MAGHAASDAGRLASRGAYQSTRVSMRAWNNLMSRNQTPETSAQASLEGGACVRILRFWLFFQIFH